MAPIGRDAGQKVSYARNQSLLAGQTVTGGRFRCTECGHELAKPVGHVSNLPVCPSCQSDSWDRA
jgi:Zn finger protein HypA/HybF involved in hydrogenase expression